MGQSYSITKVQGIKNNGGGQEDRNCRSSIQDDTRTETQSSTAACIFRV